MVKRTGNVRARVRRIREQGAIREGLEPNMALYETDRPHRSPSGRVHLTHHTNRITKRLPSYHELSCAGAKVALPCASRYSTADFGANSRESDTAQGTVHCAGKKIPRAFDISRYILRRDCAKTNLPDPSDVQEPNCKVSK